MHVPSGFVIDFILLYMSVCERGGGVWGCGGGTGANEIYHVYLFLSIPLCEAELSFLVFDYLAQLLYLSVCT